MFKVPTSGNNKEGGQFVPTICSELDFSGAAWPADLNDTKKTILALALNISGSFEGNSGWGNISDDFDGMGLSLGLLNQNLGSGSLQPLLIKMNQRHPALMQKIFPQSHYQSLMGMLEAYSKKSLKKFLFGGFSEPQLDEAMTFLDFDLNAKGVKEDESVAWARTNLYKNGVFISQWKNELTTMSKTWEYVSIQIEMAKEYFDEAVDYLVRIKVSQMRSFMMFFDVVVQNGGFYTTDINEYLSFLQKNPQADETARLQKILELRLRHVKPQWVDVVRARKQAIINGAGVVNRENRQLEKEYCYGGRTTFPL